MERVERQARAGIPVHAARPEALRQMIDQSRQARIACCRPLDDQQGLTDTLAAGARRRFLHPRIEPLGQNDGLAQNAGAPPQGREARVLGGGRRRSHRATVQTAAATAAVLAPVSSRIRASTSSMT